MNHILAHIANLFTGIYAQPDILTDTLYLQGNHFSETGSFAPAVKPQLKMVNKYVKHLLQNDDILFAAKGLNNFAMILLLTNRTVACSSETSPTECSARKTPVTSNAEQSSFPLHLVISA